MSEEEDKAGDNVQNVAAASEQSAKFDTVKLNVSSVINRRSRWASSLAALRYVNGIQRDNDLRVRDSDKATAISLVLCCVAALVCLLVPQFEQHRVTFVVAADVLVGISLLMYVANRFGIVTTFQPRQAMLTWQLMLGSSLLGVFMTINLALLIAFVVSNSKIILIQ